MIIIIIIFGLSYHHGGFRLLCKCIKKKQQWIIKLERVVAVFEISLLKIPFSFPFSLVVIDPDDNVFFPTTSK